MKLINQFVYLLELALRRTATRIGSYLALAVGVLVAVTTICGLLVYADAVNVSVLRDRLSQDHAKSSYDLIIQGTISVVDQNKFDTLDAKIKNMVQNKIGLPITRNGLHGWSKSLLVIPPGQVAAGQRDTLNRTRLQFYTNLQENVDVVSGTYPKAVDDPQGTIEVAITQKLADKLGLKLGDVFSLEDFKGGSQSVEIPARLTAILALKTDQGSTWLYAPWFLDEALIVPEETYFQHVVLTVVPTESEFVWTVNYDEKAINITNVTRVIAGLTQLKFTLNQQLSGMQMLSSLSDVLNDFRTSTFVLEGLLVMLGGPVVVIALYYITMSVGLLVDAQAGEIAVLKSRGVGTAQVVIVFLLQGLLLVIPIVIVAPFLSLLLAQVIGKAETFMVFSNPRILPVSLRPQIFAYAALTGFLTLVAIVVPTIRAARGTIVSYRRDIPRSKQSSFIHRFFLDIVLLVLGGLGYRLLSQNKTIITTNSQGGLQFDPLLLVTPILLAAGVALVMLRILPLLFRLLARIDSYTEHIAPLFALRQVARSSGNYNGLILILTFTLALGLFTTSVANAFDSNYSDQAMYAAGADISTHEFDYATATWKVRPLADYSAIPGVVAVTPVYRVNLVGRVAEVPSTGVMLGIDLNTFSQSAWWRNDFNPSLDEIIHMLSTNDKAVVTNSYFASKNRLRVGDTFDTDVDGQRVDFVLAGTFDLFPTLFNDTGDRLITRLDYLKSVANLSPTEVWLKTRPSQQASVVAALKSSATYNLVVISDGHELSGVRKDDPLRTGLFGALSMGFIVASLLSILGFLLYAYINIQNRSLQFGVLRATGLSVNQLIATISTEQLALIALGLFIGTAVGGGAGWLFTSFLQVSIIAREAVPPFMVTIPWKTISELYLILLGIFALALGLSVYLLRRMRVASVLRLGEQ